MASHDETPTNRSTAGDEPLDGAPAPSPGDAKSESGAGSHAVPPGGLSGTSEHADWDAEFDSLTGTERAEAEAAQEAEAAEADAVAEPSVADADAESPDAAAAATSAEAAESAARESEAAEPETVESDTVVLDAAESHAVEADVLAAEQADSENPGTPVADVGGTVPGGHPLVAQRSHLPMRRASTLPDLSSYEPADADNDAADRTAEEAEGEQTHAVPAGSPGVGQHAFARSGSHEASPNEGDGDVLAAHDDGSTEDGVEDSAVENDAVHSGAVDGGAGAYAAGTAGMAAAAGTAAATRDTATGTGDAAGNNAAVDESTTDDTATDDTATKADDDVDPSLSAAEAQRRAQEREKAAAGKPVLARFLQVMIAVFFPVMVLAAAIRAVATPLFLWVEYHRPGFPADSFGFSADDRMTYGSYAVDYLLNWSGSRYLGDLVGDSGEPLYLPSEVSHMADVKTVLTVAFVAATVMAVLSLLAALYLWRRSPGGIRRSLFSGAVLTLVLVAAMVVLAVLGWEQFFTQVHSIFFANGNWTFRMDDTLIRLFPAQFWMDAGIVIAALVLLTCTVLLVCCWPTRARRERVQQERADARRRYDESLDAL